MYATPADLKFTASESLLLQLADDTSLATFDDPVVQAVLCEQIEQADREIDAYVALVAPVPLNPAPALIANLSAKIAVYNLHRRRPHLELGNWKTEYDRCLRLLERIAAGRTMLTASADAPAQADPGGVTVLAPRPIFGDDVLERY